MTMLGGSGLAATVRKDAASIKSLNLTAAAVVALLASAFVYQVRTAANHPLYHWQASAAPKRKCRSNIAWGNCIPARSSVQHRSMPK